jgi:hypothetical protein
MSFRFVEVNPIPEGRGCFGAAGDIELAIDALQVRLHGFFRHGKVPRNASGGGSAGH